MKLEIGQTEDGSVRTLTVRGDLDMDSSPNLRDAIKKAITGGTTLRIELSGVGYIDSSGIAVLIQGHKWALKSQVAFRLVTPSPKVQAVIKLAQLQTLFTIEPVG
jgi:anti-sigma B factor antagonist